MALHVCFESLYMSLPSFAKQLREMTKSSKYFGERIVIANFSCLPFELNAVITYLA